MPVLRNIKETHIVLCTQETAFIESKDATFINLFQEYYHNYRIVDDLAADVTAPAKFVVQKLGASLKLLPGSSMTQSRSYRKLNRY